MGSSSDDLTLAFGDKLGKKITYYNIIQVSNKFDEVKKGDTIAFCHNLNNSSNFVYQVRYTNMEYKAKRHFENPSKIISKKNKYLRLSN